MKPLGQSYLEDELKGALIVDSLGFIYGSLNSINITPGRIEINVILERPTEATVVDVEKLKEDLLQTVKKRFGKPTEADLMKQVRKELGVAHVSTSQLVEYASKHEIEIPLKVVQSKRKISKIPISWELVDKIGKTRYGVCILLKEPVEARRRARIEEELEQKIKYLDRTELREKLVIDSEAKIIGKPIDISFTPQQINLIIPIQITKTLHRINRGKLLNIIAYKTKKKPQNIVPLILAEYGATDTSEVTDSQLRRWTKKYFPDVEIPYQTFKVSDTKRIEIGWNNIKAIGDVILLNTSIKLPEEA